MTLDQDDVLLARRWLKNPQDWFNDQEIKSFNHEFARWNGSKYAYSFMGGRIALSACIYALDLRPNEEVIIPAYTCIVVPNAFKQAGIKIVYCDIELDTFGFDIQSLKKTVTAQTKAILLHHLYGLVCRDYKEILAFAKQHNLKVIEDCAQSTGAEFAGKKIGNGGDVAFYSSEQSKIFSTIQGGIAITNDEKIKSRLQEYYDNASYPNKEWINKQLCNIILNYYTYKHPKRWILRDLINIYLGHTRLISTSRDEEKGGSPQTVCQKMPAPVASIGLNQLKKINNYNQQRAVNAKKWDAWTEKNGYKKAYVVEESIPVFLRYPFLVEPEKKKNKRWARHLKIELGEWFIGNFHPVKGSLDQFPNAKKAITQCVNFPCLGVELQCLT